MFINYTCQALDVAMRFERFDHSLSIDLSSVGGDVDFSDPLDVSTRSSYKTGVKDILQSFIQPCLQEQLSKR